MDRDTKLYLAETTDKKEVALEMMKDQDEKVRRNLVFNQFLSGEFLSPLADDSSPLVRACFATRADIPLPVLMRLHNDSSIDVAVEAIKNPNTLFTTIVRFYYDRFFKEQEAAEYVLKLRYAQIPEENLFDSKEAMLSVAKSFLIIDRLHAMSLWLSGIRCFSVISSDGSDRYADCFETIEELNEAYPDAIFGLEKYKRKESSL